MRVSVILLALSTTFSSAQEPVSTDDKATGVKIDAPEVVPLDETYDPEEEDDGM